MSGPNPLTDLHLTVTDDVGEVAMALAQLFKFFDGLNAVVNSPAMISARKNADVQRALQQMDDDLAQARKTGDLTQADKDASG